MRFADLLGLAWTNLQRNQMRSLLTGTGVMIGVAALFMLLAYGSGLQYTAQQEYEALKLHNTLRVTSQQIPFLTGTSPAASASTGSVQPTEQQIPLTDSLIQEIEALEDVLAAYPEVNFPAKLRGPAGELVVQAETIPLAFRSLDAYAPQAGRFFEDADEAAILLAPSVAERVGYSVPTDAVGDTLKLVTASLNWQKLTQTAATFATGSRALPMGQRPYSVEVAGLLHQKNTPVSGFTRVLIPTGFAEELNKVTFFSTLDLLFRHAEAQSGYTAVRVQLEEAANHAKVEQKIEQMGVHVASFQAQFARLENLFLVLDWALGIIGAIALIVAVIGIANTVMMNVRERTREVGIMMAIGGAASDLQRLFVVESAILGAVGALAGLAFGGLVILGLDYGVNAYLGALGVPPLTIFTTSWVTVAGIWAGAVFVSFLAGLAPARRAAHVEPVEALRAV